MNIARIHLLLVALICEVSIAQQFPTTVEFDLVFPRNATYAPTQLLPLVFAIQNPQVAAWFTLEIDWTLLQFGRQGSITSGTVDLRDYNLSSSGSSPYFIVQTTHALNTTATHEGIFSLIWDLVIVNCSDIEGGRTLLGTTSGGHNNTIFTVKEQAGAISPGLESLVPTAGTAVNEAGCPAQSFTYNITGSLLVDSYSAHVPSDFKHDTCPVLADLHPPAKPCAATVDNVIVSSISAGITASLCSAGVPVITGCPAAAASKKSSAGTLSPGTALFGLLLGLCLI